MLRPGTLSPLPAYMQPWAVDLMNCPHSLPSIQLRTASLALAFLWSWPSECVQRVGQPGWRRAMFRVHGDPLNWNGCWPATLCLRADLRDWGFRAGLRHLGAQSIFLGGAQGSHAVPTKVTSGFHCKKCCDFSNRWLQLLFTNFPRVWGGVGEGVKVGTAPHSVESLSNL